MPPQRRRPNPDREPWQEEPIGRVKRTPRYADGGLRGMSEPVTRAEFNALQARVDRLEREA